MFDPALDAVQYGEYMDRFLVQLKNEVDTQSKAIIAPHTDQESLDKYLLDINSFYYESFHRRFFPQYKKTIEENIRSLYHISKQDQALKKDIIASLKQHVRLFNQIKITSALLKRKRQEIEPLLLAFQQGGNARCADLLYLLKEHSTDWTSFMTQLGHIQTLLEDKKLLAAMNQYPIYTVVSKLFCEWEPDNSKAIRSLNRLLATWQLAARLLLKLQEQTISDKELLGQLITELEKIDAGWDNRKVPPAIRTWYKQNIQSIYRLYLEAVKLNGERNDRKPTTRVAVQFENWLNSLLYMVEQTLLYKSRGWSNLINQLHLLNQMDENYCKELVDYGDRFTRSMHDLIHSLSSSSETSYKYHSQRSSQILSDAHQYLQQQLNNGAASRGIILTPTMQRLLNQLDLCEGRLELLDEKDEHALQTSQQYSAIIASLDSNLELLAAIKYELERLLAPRNIKRDFQDINLRIDHIAIATGALFPSDYSYLVDQGVIETQVTDVPEGRILYEDGDIFIIQLDEFREEEIPKIIIAKKG
jgi:hypothetical protein